MVGGPMTVVAKTDHPAKFSLPILEAFRRIVDVEQDELGRGLRVLDPFAGVGRIHELRNHGAETFGVEIEPEWAACHRWTKVGDATDLKFGANHFDAVMTSPCYGNRMADHHEAKDSSKRKGYRFSLGRELSDGSAAGLQWGDEYQKLHSRAIEEMVRVVRPGGLVVVDMSNHQRDWKIAYVTDWWVAELLAQGLHLEQVAVVRTQRMRFGTNSEARVPTEHIIVTRKDAPLEVFEPRPPRRRA